MTQDPDAFLESMLRIPSLSGEEEILAAFLVQRMGEMGFRTHRDQVGNVFGEAGNLSAERTLVMLGHMDTVPGVIPVRREKNRLYGRGAVDAKGPLAAFILAAAQVKRKLNDKRVIVIGAVEEEARSKGAHRLTQTLPPPEGVIIGEPSGWQGISLGYKGTVQVHYQLSKSAGHSAGRESTPAEEGVAFWNKLLEYTAEFNGDRHPPRFDTLDSALRSICTRGDGLQDSVEMKINLRIPLGFDEESLQTTIQGWCNESEVDFPYSEPAFEADKNTPVVRALLRAVRQVGGRPRFKVKTGTSDMNVVGHGWGCPIATYGPGDSSLDHTPNEYIELSEFRKGVRVLAKALTLW